MKIPEGRVSGALELHYIRLPDRHFQFRSHLLEATDSTMILAHEASPSAPLYYRGQEVMARGYGAVWFLFKGEAYDIARFYRPDGTWTGYYVDVLEPVVWDCDDPSTLAPIVDLFLDVWISPEGDFVVLDEDEFEDARTNGILSSDQAMQARATLEGIVERTAAKGFPPVLVKAFRL